jgi:predicted RNase H-like nuclease (RuvC/YqgF family)
LEKKHNVSDAEIISLTEEKLRLQAQVIDLERDVEDLSRSRDECRQSAVQEGAQYVEIVRQASQLEERTQVERKSWGILKAEMEKKIEVLNRSGQTGEGGPSNEAQNPPIADGTETPASPPEPSPILKMEPMSEPSSSAENQPANNIPAPETAAPPPPPASNQDSAEELHEEIQRLRHRCIEMEDTLRTVREESRSMEGIVEALGLAGKKITDKANSALEIESSD